MLENTEISGKQSDGHYYQIRLKGYLNPNWSDWFDGLSISHEPNGDTILSGFIKDQSALFGIFQRIQNLGLTLLSVVNLT